MTPVKNGVLLYLREYDCWIVSDFYHFRPWSLFRTNSYRHYEKPEGFKAEVVVHRIEHWFDADQDFGVLIADDMDVEKVGSL